ncbi:protein translocase SEC61 complex subunit gamma [Candidatus Woesearchaeota archaeon]|nr:protein translocase SEC61 complex subunit gamma [Candidatus Woesearchaeota archaeon]
MGFKEFYKESLRVFRITKKPDKVEFKTVVKVSGLGILVIGLIGFIVHMVGYALKLVGF